MRFVTRPFSNAGIGGGNNVERITSLEFRVETDRSFADATLTEHLTEECTRL